MGCEVTTQACSQFISDMKFMQKFCGGGLRCFDDQYSFRGFAYLLALLETCCLGLRPQFKCHRKDFLGEFKARHPCLIKLYRLESGDKLVEIEVHFLFSFLIRD